MKVRISLIILSLIIPLTTLKAQTTLRVPSQYNTIHEALDAASEGDSIIVSPGMYRGMVDIGGKNIILASEFIYNQDTSYYIMNTVISGEDTASAVQFYGSGITTNTQLIGFRLTNGYNSGIYCNGSSPIIAMNFIEGNTGENGGAIACYNNSSPLIINNIITGNSVSGGDGGSALYASSGRPYLINNTIVGNHDPDRRPAANAAAGPVPPSSDALPAARVALPHNLPSTLPRSRLSLARLNPKHGGGPDDSLCPP